MTLIRSLAVLLTLGLSLGQSPQPAVAAEATLAGRSLIDAIDQLEARGLTVYYSSDLVRPWMTVKGEPIATTPADILAEIVAPYDLEVQTGPYDSLLITRPDRDDVATGRVLGIVRDRRTGRRIGGATVILEGGADSTNTSASGHFSFTELPPGRHVVQITGSGLDEAARAVVDVKGGETTVTLVDVDESLVHKLDAIVVSTSRYELFDRPTGTRYGLAASDIQNLPDIGDDPLRAVARLPGTATGGLTAESNIRGGVGNETLVHFDGLRLYNPFHLRDFQKVFSAIDPATISSIDVYTGGYPVTFGDRMSGVIDIRSLEIPLEPYTEVSQSFFNSSIMTTGSVDDGRVDWLVSGRRGNLDLLLDIVDPDLGDPRYLEFYSRMGVQITEDLRVTGNVIYSDEDINLVDSDEEEEAEASYTDEYYWLRIDREFDHGLSSSTLLAHTNLSYDRNGSTDKEEVTVGRVRDERSFDIDTIQTNWSWAASERLLLQLGGEFRHMEGNYDYADEAQFALVFLTPGASLETEREREFHLSPEGDQMALWLSGRIGLTDRLSADLGLRWDKQTLSDDDEVHTSPRVSAMYAFSDHSSLRASWGRFYQYQSIDELQIVDGVTRFQGSQRADHLVLGYQHYFENGIDLRLEAYQKDYDRLRPRYENFLYTFLLLPELQPDRIRVDADSATARGVELSLSRMHRGPLGWWLNYTWSEIDDEFSFGDIPRIWDQDHALSAGLNYEWGPYNLSLATTYRAGWRTSDAELVQAEPLAVAVVPDRNGERLQDYVVFDFRISRDIPVGDGQLTGFFEVSNVLNRRNECCVEYAFADGESDEGEIEDIELELETDRYLPVFPSLGFVWRF